MITFQDKVSINTDPSIPEINKITDQNINDLKAGVNTNETTISQIKGTILWTNSNPNTSFSAQTVTLSSSDYDVLEIIFNNQGYYKSVKVDKGKNILLDGLYYDNGTKIYYSWRFASINSNTEIHFEGSNLVQIQGSNSSFQNNNHCIPSYIIGYKTGILD